MIHAEIERVTEQTNSQLSPQERADVIVAKAYRHLAACLECGLAIRKALPVGARVSCWEDGRHWKGTIIKPQSWIAPDMAGPVQVLPDAGYEYAPATTSGEAQVEVLSLRAITDEKSRWLEAEMLRAQAASNSVKAAQLELEVAVMEYIREGSIVEVYDKDAPTGRVCKAEVDSIGTFSTYLSVRFEGKEYTRENSFDTISVEDLRAIFD